MQNYFPFIHRLRDKFEKCIKALLPTIKTSFSYDRYFFEFPTHTQTQVLKNDFSDTQMKI